MLITCEVNLYHDIKTLLYMMQNLPANVQSPFVACAKPLEVTSKAFCT